MNDKKCKDCGDIKPLTEFYKCIQNNSYYFYQSYCKDCDKKRSRAWYINNLKEGRIIRAEWQENNKALHMEHVKAYEARHPERKAAWIKARPIPMPERCEQCGDVSKICRHHPDYQKPKDVKFLCMDCHKKEHNRLVEVSA